MAQQENYQNISTAEEGDKFMDPGTILLILKSVQQLTFMSFALVNALEAIRNGDPNSVDLDALKQQLMQLPDLPTLDQIEKQLKQQLQDKQDGTDE